MNWTFECIKRRQHKAIDNVYTMIIKEEEAERNWKIYFVAFSQM